MPTMPHMLFFVLLCFFFYLLLPELGHPAFLVDLRGACDPERVVRHVLADRAAGADKSAVADGDGSDERRIGADKGFLPDFGLVLQKSVIVAGDSARADIGLFAD